MNEFRVKSSANERKDDALDVIQVSLNGGAPSEFGQNLVLLENLEQVPQSSSIKITWNSLEIENSHKLAIVLRKTIEKEFLLHSIVTQQDLDEAYHIELNEEFEFGSLEGSEIGFHLMTGGDMVVGSRVIRFESESAGLNLPHVFWSDDAWVEHSYPAKTAWLFYGQIDADTAAISDAGIIVIHERFKSLLEGKDKEQERLRVVLQQVIAVDIWMHVIMLGAERIVDSTDSTPMIVALRSIVDEANISSDLANVSNDDFLKIKSVLQSQFVEINS